MCTVRAANFSWWEPEMKEFRTCKYVTSRDDWNSAKLQRRRVGYGYDDGYGGVWWPLGTCQPPGMHCGEPRRPCLGVSEVESPRRVHHNADGRWRSASAGVGEAHEEVGSVHGGSGDGNAGPLPGSTEQLRLLAGACGAVLEGEKLGVLYSCDSIRASIILLSLLKCAVLNVTLGFRV